MTRTIPEVQWTVVPHKVAQNQSLKVYTYAYSGLLMSHGNYRLPDGKWSGGGNFYVHKESLEATPFVDLNWRLNGVTWIGTAGPSGLSGTYPSTPVPAPFGSWSAELSAFSASGIARTRPGNPVGNMGQDIIELRDVPRMLGFLRDQFRKYAFGYQRTRKGKLKDVAGHYLNYQFGVRPLVDSLIGIHRLYEKVNQRLAQIIRQNGHGVHRRTTLLDSTAVDPGSPWTFGYPFAFCAGAPPNWPIGLTRTCTAITTKKKAWFVADYRYYVPDTSSSEWTRRALRILYGVQPSPRLIWSVTPWSWLIDWFTNMRDVMSNASSPAVDNLTMNYSYVMLQSSYESVGSLQTKWYPISGGVFNNNVPGGERTFVTTYRKVTKIRAGGANPFGLGVSWESLSLYQKSILGALGITRSRFL